MSEIVTFVDTDVGRIRGETHPDLGLFVHIDIYKWDKEAIKKAKKVFAEFLAVCQQHDLPALFAGIPKDDPKNEKFAVMFGFEPTSYDLITSEGQYVYTLWKFDIEEQPWEQD